MSKKKTRVIPFAPPASAAPPPIPELEPVEGDEPLVVVESSVDRNARLRCPSCGRLSTRAYCSPRDSGVQYRKCMRPSCGQKYKVPRAD